MVNAPEVVLVGDGEPVIVQAEPTGSDGRPPAKPRLNPTRPWSISLRCLLELFIFRPVSG